MSDKMLWASSILSTHIHSKLLLKFQRSRFFFFEPVWMSQTRSVLHLCSVLFVVFWCLAQETVISSQICNSWPKLWIFCRGHCNRADWRWIDREQTAVWAQCLSQIVWHSCSCFFNVLSFTFPAQSPLVQLKCLTWQEYKGDLQMNSLEWNQLSLHGCLLNSTFNGLLFCLNSLSNHWDFLVSPSPLLTHPQLWMPTTPLHLLA